MALIAAALDYLALARHAAVAPGTNADPAGVSPWKLAGRVDLLRRRI
jgi:hypothetical protein